MIPVKLSLRNFMPYRDNVTPLDFTGIHLASICGDNGSGKSALIDAITWALWGETRAGARNHDSLIHSQENEMQVEFDFRVGEQLYRVIRRHARPKRRHASGQSSLDLFMAGGSEFQTLSGERIAETQRKISGILHMDYDTFVNSSYLRQGHADQFTVAEAGERKKVLANILGLTRYDELEAQARELSRQRENEKLLAESTIGDIDAQLATKPAVETSLHEAESRLLRLEKTSREEEVRLNDLRQQKAHLEAKQRETAQLGENIARTRKMLAQLTGQAEQHRSRIKEYEDLLERRTAIEEGYARLSEAKKRNDSLNEKSSLHARLSERKNQLARTVEKAQGEIITRHALVQQQISRLEAEEQKLPGLRTNLQRVQSETSATAGTAAQLDKKKSVLQELRDSVRGMEADTARRQREIKELEEKLDIMVAEHGARCPLCDTELGNEGVETIRTKYLADKEACTRSLQTGEVELAGKKAELKAMESEASLAEAELRQSQLALESERSLLTRQIADTEKAVGELAEARQTLTEIEESLARKDFAAAEQETIRHIDEELAGLGYDPGQHEESRRRLAGLEQYDAPKRKLEEAERLISQAKEALESSEHAASELNGNLKSDEQKQREFAAELEALPRITADLARAESDHMGSGLELKRIQETVGNIKGRLEHLGQMEATRREKEDALNRSAKEAGIYRELTEAFGRNGIQALLIEMTLPELQDQANRLLARMTDNRMHVAFETQRETKKGDVTETLDIQIADELGTRSYEMFSGGEAFRINFAIRIALSKLLAQRAGAPLPTLIIDEGFGTQDESGLEKLKEAIISIQDDFEKILVITHVDELRDAFPARIEVVKTAAGSTIELSA